MRLLIGCSVVLLFIVNTAYAQLTEIVVDGNPGMPGEDLAQVFINKEGQLVIESVANKEYELKEVVTNNVDVYIGTFSIGNANTANLRTNTSAQLHWSADYVDLDAVTCTASSTSVPEGLPLDDWNTTFGNEGTVSVEFPNRGIYTLSLLCTADGVSPDEKFVTAKVGAASITFFTVTPPTAEKGTDPTLILDWESEDSDLGCSGSGVPDWPDSMELPSIGTQEIPVTNIQPGTSFTLTCYSSLPDDEISATRSVTVTESPTACSDKVTLTQKSEDTWSQLFGVSWPGPSSGQQLVSIPPTGYYALEFSIGEELDDTGYFSNVEATASNGYRLGAISSCPGDFDVADACQHKWGSSGGILWSTEGYSDACKLDKGKTYYWNMTFTDGKNPDTSRCIGSFCQTSLKVTNR